MLFEIKVISWKFHQLQTILTSQRVVEGVGVVRGRVRVEREVDKEVEEDDKCMATKKDDTKVGPKKTRRE